MLFRNVYPVPEAPYSVLPWIFVGVLGAAVAWYVVASRGPDIGTTDVVQASERVEA